MLEDAEEGAGTGLVLDGAGEVVLAVDDEATVSIILKTLLETRGYRVMTAYDGTDAIGLFARHESEISVVLTDLAMPHMDGVTLVRSLKRLNPSVRIVVSTGQLRKGVRAELEGLGVRHILRKPYTGDELLRCLRDAIDSN